VLKKTSLQKIEEILHFMGEHSLEEIRFTDESNKEVHLRKASAHQAAPLQNYLVPTTTSTAPLKQLSPDEKKASTVKEKEDSQIILSPFVGTFYRSASPKDQPFTDVGESVSTGQTLCIVEAMKLMNEIESEFSGNIKKIYVEDGTPVEYGEKLFEVQK